MFLTRFHLPSRNLFLLPALMLVACATSGQQGMAVKDTAMFSQLRSSEHRAADDDLLTGGLGLDGLRIMVPPEFADAQAPTPAELRRRALWSSWRGIADLAPGGGYAEIYGSVARVVDTASFRLGVSAQRGDALSVGTHQWILDQPLPDDTGRAEFILRAVAP